MSTKRILGIDPGTATTGWGVIQNGKVLGCGLISTDKKQAHGVRLNLIYQGISDLIEKYDPEEVAIERLFLPVTL